MDDFSCCGNCVWFKLYEDPEPDAEVDGECRRFPQQVYGTTADDVWSAFPGSKLEEYCGEWKGR